MSDHERDEMIRENERMKTALKSIEQYATNANFGVWRHVVVKLARLGLYRAPV
jgi:hypothetical protein